MSIHQGGRGPGHKARLLGSSSIVPDPGPGPTTRIGLVATRTGGPTITNGTTSAGNKQGMFRSGHQATESVTWLKLVYALFLINNPTSGREGGFGQEGGVDVIDNSFEIRCSIEYPAGVINRVTFDVADQIGGDPTRGKAITARGSGAIAGDKNYVVTARCNVAIPKGATFWVNTWTSSTIGIFYQGNGSQDAAWGDRLRIGTTTADLTDTGVFSNQISAGIFRPWLILSDTSGPTVGLVGDSITAGQGQSIANNPHGRGIIGNSIPATVPHVNLGMPGATTATWIQQCINRAYAFQFVTHVACNLGVNGVGTPEQILAANVATMQANFPNALRKYLVTLTPRGGGPWATESTQTPHGGVSGYIAYSDLIRAGGAGWDACIDVTRGVLEGALNSGKWRGSDSAPSVPAALTGDGLHPNDNGYNYVATSGAVPASLWAMP